MNYKNNSIRIQGCGWELSFVESPEKKIILKGREPSEVELEEVLYLNAMHISLFDLRIIKICLAVAEREQKLTEGKIEAVT